MLKRWVIAAAAWYGRQWEKSRSPLLQIAVASFALVAFFGFALPELYEAYETGKVTIRSKNIPGQRTREVSIVEEPKVFWWAVAGMFSLGPIGMYSLLRGLVRWRSLANQQHLGSGRERQ